MPFSIKPLSRSSLHSIPNRAVFHTGLSFDICGNIINESCFHVQNRNVQTICVDHGRTKENPVNSSSYARDTTEGANPGMDILYQEKTVKNAVQ